MHENFQTLILELINHSQFKGFPVCKEKMTLTTDHEIHCHQSSRRFVEVDESDGAP